MKRRSTVLLLVTTMAATVPACETARAGAQMSNARLEFMRSGTPSLGPILYVGDSLGVGTFPELRRLLPDVALDGDNRIGRSSGEGLRALRSTLRRKHGIVIFDIGTNDRDAATMTRNLKRARKRAGDRLLVVFTLNKPGVAPLNRVLRDFAGSADNVELVDWRAVAAHAQRPESRPAHSTKSSADRPARRPPPGRRARCASAPPRGGACVIPRYCVQPVAAAPPRAVGSPWTFSGASSRRRNARQERVPLFQRRICGRITAVAVCAGGAP